MGALIRSRRRAHGLTQARLARRAGTSQAAVSRIERGRVDPGTDTVANLLLALGEELDIRTRPLEPQGDPARLAALRALSAERRVELAWSWNRLGGEIAVAGARARGEVAASEPPRAPGDAAPSAAEAEPGAAADALARGARSPRREVPLDAAEILRALVRREVDFVVIGGLAVQAHGHVRTTQDADIMPRADPENLRLLADALNDIGARPVGAVRPERRVSAEDLAPDRPVAYDTDAGGLDVHSHPPGADAYASVRARAFVVAVFGLQVPFAGLDDLVAMKLASGRPIDRGDVATLTSRGSDRG